MKFQLWTTDEYGQNSIVSNSTDLEALIKKAKTEVHNINCENALTAEEKKRNWEAMYVELIDSDSDEAISDAVYAGVDNTGKPAIQPLGESKALIKFAQASAKIKAYLGNLNYKDWYAADERGKEISDINHPDLKNKTVYFIRRIA